MTSLKQIEANRRNALKSTGPRTETGKQRSRRNATRHGLTAETVIEPLENPEDYKAFEMSITAEFDAQTAVERELVLRFASLLWRLRRSTALETGLLQISEPYKKRPGHCDPGRMTHSVSLMEVALTGQCGGSCNKGETSSRLQMNNDGRPDVDPATRCGGGEDAELAVRFLRLASFDSGAFERLTRYEMALWRQVTQLLFLLNGFCRPSHRRFTPTAAEWDIRSRKSRGAILHPVARRRGADPSEIF